MTELTIALNKLKVPTPLALGLYEYLSDEELHDHTSDIVAEYRRRLHKRPAED